MDAFRSAVPDDITDDALIGAGRYGSVFKALWHANCAHTKGGVGAVDDAVGDRDRGARVGASAAIPDGGSTPTVSPGANCPYGLGPRCAATVVA
eukprot:CAMPEP_0206323234 /NCGR_PEP_ID=MMETSP0106_2-20121207/19862_1 /ASSEMBLY_ACC=CAM_ASM_000206 /TAXON_ID=81532 /ORGANISM="Acanthoeca-like sp., Strain 10tr" /LENGTH=93 /DNA_ID=CAMNT_0053755483 /DNA_START=25 /DNA_END=302 /DNA_ORIENTATION=+